MIENFTQKKCIWDYSLQWYYSWHRTYFKGQILLVSWLLSPVSHLQLRGAALKQNFNSSITGHSQLSARQVSEYFFYSIDEENCLLKVDRLVWDNLTLIASFQVVFKVRTIFWPFLLAPMKSVCCFINPGHMTFYNFCILCQIASNYQFWG